MFRKYSYVDRDHGWMNRTFEKKNDVLEVQVRVQEIGDRRPVYAYYSYCPLRQRCNSEGWCQHVLYSYTGTAVRNLRQQCNSEGHVLFLLSSMSAISEATAKDVCIHTLVLPLELLLQRCNSKGHILFLLRSSTSAISEGWILAETAEKQSRSHCTGAHN